MRYTAGTFFCVYVYEYCFQVDAHKWNQSLKGVCDSKKKERDLKMNKVKNELIRQLAPVQLGSSVLVLWDFCSKISSYPLFSLHFAVQTGVGSVPHSVGEKATYQTIHVTDSMAESEGGKPGKGSGMEVVFVS